MTHEFQRCGRNGATSEAQAGSAAMQTQRLSIEWSYAGDVSLRAAT